MKKKRGCMTAPGIALGIVMMFTGCRGEDEAAIPMVIPQKIVITDSGQTIIQKQEQTKSGETGQEEAKQEETKQLQQEQEAESVPENIESTESIENTESTESTESPATQQVSITISATGDVTMGNHREQGYELSFNQTYDKLEDKGYFFENVADIFKEDDMTIVNLEGVLTLSENYAEDRTYNIKGLPEYANLLRDGFVETVSMANNHRQDYGEEGIRDTIDALESAGIAYAYDKNLGIYETQGIKIGWVSVNETSQGVYVEKLLEEGIRQLREEGADLVLACCHWGIEREYYPEDYQKELGKKCIDWGADLVLGHHPHVLQGIEQYQGKYIVYSLGNFCFGANRNPSDKDTMIFQQTFTFRQEETAQGTLQWSLTEDTQARIIPCRISSVTSRNDYKPTPLTGEEGQQVINRVNEYSMEFGVTADADGVLRKAE